MATWPNFFIIGAPKAGTTSLYDYLNQHPQVFMSPTKEPRFFSWGDTTRGFLGPKDKEVENIVVKQLEDYLALFAGVREEKAIGEASVDYLSSPLAPERIARNLPKAKLIAILRNPIDRAYSNYLHVVRQGRERLIDFKAACEEENKRIEAGWMYFWHYIDTGFYYRHLKRYFKRFPSEQIKVILYEDFKKDNRGELRKIFHFLEVDEDFCPDVSHRHNDSHASTSPFLTRLLYSPSSLKDYLKKYIPKNFRHFLKDCLGKGSVSKASSIPHDLDKTLKERFREDIIQLQDLIKKDLHQWLRKLAQN